MSTIKKVQTNKYWVGPNHIKGNDNQKYRLDHVLISCLKSMFFKNERNMHIKLVICESSVQ